MNFLPIQSRKDKDMIPFKNIGKKLDRSIETTIDNRLMIKQYIK